MRKFSEILLILLNFEKIAKQLANFDKNEITELCKGVHCVDLGGSFPTHIFLQNLASMRPRTSPVKSERRGSERRLGPRGIALTAAAASSCFWQQKPNCLLQPFTTRQETKPTTSPSRKPAFFFFRSDQQRHDPCEANDTK